MGLLDILSWPFGGKEEMFGAGPTDVGPYTGYGQPQGLLDLLQQMIRQIGQGGAAMPQVQQRAMTAFHEGVAEPLTTNLLERALPYLQHTQALSGAIGTGAASRAQERMVTDLGAALGAQGSQHLYNAEQAARQGQFGVLQYILPLVEWMTNPGWRQPYTQQMAQPQGGLFSQLFPGGIPSMMPGM